MTASFPTRSGQHHQRPEMFETWMARFPTTDGGLTAATKTLYEGYRSFYGQVHQTNKDETCTPGARLVKNVNAARAIILPLVDQLEAANAKASERAAKLEARTAEVYNPPDKKYETCMRHAEIRAHFKLLPRAERLQAVENARKAGDEDTLIAIASYQPYLSGVDPQQHAFARNHLIEAHAPSEAAALKSIREQQGYVAGFCETMLQSVADLLDFSKADELIVAAQGQLAAN